MGSYKKIGLSHEMGLIDTPPLTDFFFLLFSTVYNAKQRDMLFKQVFNMERSKGIFVRENLKK